MDPVPSREIADMPGEAALPRKNGELVFDEAWQGRIFGLTVAMSHESRFAWRERITKRVSKISATTGNFNRLMSINLLILTTPFRMRPVKPLREKKAS